MENFERRTFPTTVKTLDGKKRVPTEAELSPFRRPTWTR
jgi:hypothetical protein